MVEQEREPCRQDGFRRYAPPIVRLANLPNTRVLARHHQIPPIPSETDYTAKQQELVFAVGNSRKRKGSDAFPIQELVNFYLDVDGSTFPRTIHNDSQQATVWRDRDSINTTDRQPRQFFPIVSRVNGYKGSLMLGAPRIVGDRGGDELAFAGDTHLGYLKTRFKWSRPHGTEIIQTDNRDLAID